VYRHGGPGLRIPDPTGAHVLGKLRLRIFAVVPTYNEAENLPGLVSALFSLSLDLELLIVDDSSPDGTAQVAEHLASGRPGIHILRRPAKEGLRSAYLAGFQRSLASEADAILQMDADMSHDPARIPDMVHRLETCDVVLGSRYVEGGSVDRDWPRWRQGLSAFGNRYARTILGAPTSDLTTGFRLWRRSTLRGMPLDRIRSNGYVFLVEMAYLAYCLEYRMGEVPIHFKERRHGRSKMSLGIQVEAALRIWQVWWQYRDLRRHGSAARLS
jgi:dolichol-phosphate mannosyltransferase